MSETAPGYAERTVPEFHPIADRKLNSLLADGWQINGYAIMKGEDRRGFVDFGGFVGWWLPEYYASHTSDATFEAAEAEVARLKDGIEQALKNVAYKAGDHPIVPIKYNAFEAAIRSLTAAKGG